MRRCGFLLFLLLLRPGSLFAQQRSPERQALDVLLFQGRRAVELARLRDRDPWLSRQPLYQSLWLRESGARDSLVFDLLPFASAPRARDGIALSFDLGTGSRMWTGFTEPQPVRGALLGTAAQAVMALWGLLPPRVGAPQDVLQDQQCPGMRLRLGSEAVHGFGTDGRDAPLDTRAVIAYADCQRDLGGSWHLVGGVRGYYWRTPGISDRQDLETAVRLARIPRNNGLRLFADASWTPRYRRTMLHVERPFSIGRLQFRPLMRLAWGEELPFGLGFWPGGFDGFPGFKPGQGRGNRETMTAVDVIHPLAGRLSFRTLVAAGRTAVGGPLIAQGPWLIGVRAGLNLDTRWGLVRLEYGVSSHNHRAFLIRLGQIL
jgi:hypothetical protein